MILARRYLFSLLFLLQKIQEKFSVLEKNHWRSVTSTTHAGLEKAWRSRWRKSSYGHGAAAMLPAALQITSAVVLAAGCETSGQAAPITHQSLGSH